LNEELEIKQWSTEATRACNATVSHATHTTKPGAPEDGSDDGAVDGAVIHREDVRRRPHAPRPSGRRCRDRRCSTDAGHLKLGRRSADTAKS